MPFWYTWRLSWHRMQPLPGHLFGPPQHRLRIDQLRAIPLQLSDSPAPLNRIIFAVGRRVIHQLDGLLNGVGQLDHPLQKLRAPATALWPVVHFELEQTGGCLLWLSQRGPLGGSLHQGKTKVHKIMEESVNAARPLSPTDWARENEGKREKRGWAYGVAALYNAFTSAYSPTCMPNASA